jgi:hypothetical protein
VFSLLKAGFDSGGDRLRSHSFMKSEAVRVRLLGVRRFNMGGRSSSSLGGVIEDDFSLLDMDKLARQVRDRRGEKHKSVGEPVARYLRCRQLWVSHQGMGALNLGAAVLSAFLRSPYTGMPFSSLFSGIVAMSPLAVEPLHRGDLVMVGVSQLDQS